MFSNRLIFSSAQPECKILLLSKLFIVLSKRCIPLYSFVHCNFMQCHIRCWKAKFILLKLYVDLQIKCTITHQLTIHWYICSSILINPFAAFDTVDQAPFLHLTALICSYLVLMYAAISGNRLQQFHFLLLCTFWHHAKSFLGSSAYFSSICSPSVKRSEHI